MLSRALGFVPPPLAPFVFRPGGPGWVFRAPSTVLFAGSLGSFLAMGGWLACFPTGRLLFGKAALGLAFRPPNAGFKNLKKNSKRLLSESLLPQRVNSVSLEKIMNMCVCVCVSARGAPDREKGGVPGDKVSSSLWPGERGEGGSPTKAVVCGQ